MLKKIFELFDLSRESSTPPEPLLEEDFEKSPLRFEYEVILEEYRILWTELHARLGYQHQIINFAIALSAAIIAFLQLASGDQSLEYSVQLLRPVYPFVSLLFSALSLMYLEHDAAMAHLGIYIDAKLRPKIENILLLIGNESHVWQWGRWRAHRQFRKLPTSPIHYVMAASRYALTIGPSIAFAILYWIYDPHTRPWSIPEWIVFGLVLLMIFWVLITVWYVSTLYYYRREIVATEEVNVKIE